MTKTYIHEFLKCRVIRFLLFKLVFTKQLMGSVHDKRLKLGYEFQHDVSHIRDDVIVFLPLCKAFGKDRVDS